MDWFTPQFRVGLLIGLAIGLGVAVYFWFAGWIHRRALVREVAALKEHLHRQMDITAKGSDTQQKELERLRQQNENLRITNATLKQKSGRAELDLLMNYERALRVMNTKAPGFAPAWELALKDAEAELAATNSGFMPLVRKALKPVFGRLVSSTTPQQLEASDEPAQLPDRDPKSERGGAPV